MSFEKLTKKELSSNGRKGGKVVLKKYGKNYFSELAKKRYQKKEEYEVQ